MTQGTIVLAAMLIATMPALAETGAVLDIGQVPARGKTQLWSPLFQASWDKLNSMHGGKPDRVVPPNPLVARLDQFQWSEGEVMPKGGYAVFAGPATPEFATDTAAQIGKQFGVEMAPGRLPGSPRGLAIYGILIRDLNFQTEFFRARQQALDFKGRLGRTHKVQFFGTIGTHSDGYGDSVKVLGYRDGGKSFVLSVATDRADEKLIIYRPSRALSFKLAMEQVRSARKTPPDGSYGSLTDGTLHKNDVVKIPYLTLKANTDFTKQLKGARHYPREDLPWEIEMAYQITQFELFEKGARIRVETAIEDGPFGNLPKPRRVHYVPRRFVCDKPFFVFAWKEKAKWPYFAAWIDGGEALSAFRRK